MVLLTLLRLVRSPLVASALVERMMQGLLLGLLVMATPPLRKEGGDSSWREVH